MTLQMGIKHFSGLFVMLCVGVALSLLTTMAEHLVYKVVIPRVHEPRFKYWLHTSQRLHRALNSAFTDDQLTTVTDPQKRCNEGNHQSASRNPPDSSHSNRRRLLLSRIQKELERPPAQELPCSLTPQTPPQPLPPLEQHSSNGRSELIGRGFGSGSGLTLGQCRGLGAGHRGPGPVRATLVQELSELEDQIQVIKQQLQAAMRRKQELEQFQSEHRPATGTGSSQPTAHQFSQCAQSHQHTNQHTSTGPEF